MDGEKDKITDSSTKKEENITKSSGKAIRSHLWAFLLVAFGVVFYLALNNLDSIGTFLLNLVSVLSPLFIGALIALILNTPMCAIGQFLTWLFKKIFSKKDKEYKPNKRGIEIASLCLTILIALFIIYIVVYSVVPQVIGAVKTLLVQAQVKLPEYISKLDEYSEFGINTDTLRNMIAGIDFNTVFSKLTDNAGGIIDTVISGASSIISGAFTAFTSVVFAVYLLANKLWLSVQAKKLFYATMKKKTVERTLSLFSTVGDTFSNFISGQCLDAVLLGLMMFVSMSVFGFRYALPISAMITVTAIIPYIGAFLGGAFGAVLIVMDSPMKALLFIILFIIIQQIDNHLVYPRVVGGSVGLPPIWTFAAVIIGGALFGIIGMVLFIPFFSVVYTIIDENVAKRLAERGITVEEPDYDSDGSPKRKTLISEKISALGEKIKESDLFKKTFRSKEKRNSKKH